MANDEREQLKFHWGDRVYTADDLTIDDVIVIEEEMGEPFTAIDWRAMKPVTLLVALARAHEMDGTPFEQVLAEVRSVKVGTLAEQMDASGVADDEGGERPTPRRSRSAASKRDGKPARSGKRGTSSTATSPPGTSGA